MKSEPFQTTRTGTPGGSQRPVPDDAYLTLSIHAFAVVVLVVLFVRTYSEPDTSVVPAGMIAKMSAEIAPVKVMFRFCA